MKDLGTMSDTYELAEIAAIEILTEGRIRFDTMFNMIKFDDENIKQCLVECSDIVDHLNQLISEAETISNAKKIPTTRL